LGLGSEAFEPHDSVPVAVPPDAAAELDGAAAAVDDAAPAVLGLAVPALAVLGLAVLDVLLLDEPQAARNAAPAKPPMPARSRRRLTIEKPTSDGLGDRSDMESPLSVPAQAHDAISR